MQPLEFLTKIETFVKTNPEKFDFFGLVKLQNPEHPRNNVGNWQTLQIRAAKDIAMTSDCDVGIVIWDGMSKGSP